MQVLPRLRTTVSAIGQHLDRIRLYQSFVLFADSHALPQTARRRLGLSD